MLGSLIPSSSDESETNRGGFLSTFKEWHYFIGGAAIGFIVGAEWALRRVTDE